MIKHVIEYRGKVYRTTYTTASEALKAHIAALKAGKQSAVFQIKQAKQRGI